MSGPSTRSGRAVEKIDKGKEVEHTLDDDNNNPMGSFNTNPQSDPSTADNTSSNTQTQLEVMRNHIARKDWMKKTKNLSTLQSNSRAKDIPTRVLPWAVCQALNLYHSSNDGDYPSTLSLSYRDLQSPIRRVVPQRHPILMVPTLCNHRSPAQVYAGLQEILCRVKKEFWGSRRGTDCGTTKSIFSFTTMFIQL